MQQYTPFEYIKIDLANHFGYDKETFKSRIDWVDENRDNITGMFNDAKKPLLARKAFNALVDAENGIATGFMCSLDASASGLQIMAALSGCHRTARNVNLINTGVRENAYKKVADLINAGCGTQYTTADVKKPCMTTFYNSTAQPKNVFGGNTPEIASFYDALWQLFPSAMEMLGILKGFQDPTALDYTWTLPDGHTAVVKVMCKVDKKIEVDELNHATFTHRAKINMATDFDLSLPANIVQSVDGYIVREMYRLATEQEFELLTVHDEFFASPNYMQNVRENYCNILANIADMDLFGSILRDITGNYNLGYTKSSNDLSKEILLSEYCLT